MRTAQVTLYAIFGIIILLIVFVLIAIARSAKPEVETVPKAAAFATGALQESMDMCVGSLLMDSAYRVGLHGGYINGSAMPDFGEPGVPSIVNGNLSIPILINNSRFFNLSADDVAKRICRLVYMQVGGCIPVQQLNDSGYDVLFTASPSFDQADGNCSIAIQPDSLAITVAFPVSLSQDGRTSSLSSFSAKAPLSMGTMINKSEMILRNATRHARYNITEDCDLLAAPFLSVSVLVPQPGETIVRFVDRRPSAVTGMWPSDFVWQFAVEGHWLAGSCG